MCFKVYKLFNSTTTLQESKYITMQGNICTLSKTAIDLVCTVAIRALKYLNRKKVKINK